MGKLKPFEIPFSSIFRFFKRFKQKKYNLIDTIKSDEQNIKITMGKNRNKNNL